MSTSLIASSTVDLSDEQLVETINDHHAAATSAAQTALSRALAAGDALAEAKRRCRHGEWGGWLAKHFAGSDRTARAYMRLASNRELIESKSADSAVLSIDSAMQSIAIVEGKPEESERCWEPAPAWEYDHEGQLREIRRCAASTGEGPAACAVIYSRDLEWDADFYKVHPLMVGFARLLIEVSPSLHDEVLNGRLSISDALLDYYHPQQVEGEVQR